MRKTLVAIAAVAASLFAVQAAVAQGTTTKKAETANSQVAKGEGCVDVTAGSKSTAARADVKKDAIAANKAGATDKGEGCVNPTAGTKSTAARADVKKEAAAAVKAGTVGKGEADIKK